MIKTCQQCGAVNGDPSDICCFCDAPLGGFGHSPVSRRAIPPIEGNLAVEPEWRREVSSRLHDFRARRRGGAVAELQSPLPFDSESASPVEASRTGVEYASPAPSKKAFDTRASRHERFEIAIPNQETDSKARNGRWPSASRPATGLASPAIYSVASLRERRRAAFVDAALLIFSYGGMLALFTVLGGHIGFNKVDLGVAGATFALFYAQYFTLFTVFGGSTPGMMLLGLRVVGFDGSIPTSRQMAWRSFGYLISGGLCFLGFIWALWDDDGLCWQDRISQTYLTPNEQVTPHRG